MFYELFSASFIYECTLRVINWFDKCRLRNCNGGFGFLLLFTSFENCHSGCYFLPLSMHANNTASYTYTCIFKFVLLLDSKRSNHICLYLTRYSCASKYYSFILLSFVLFSVREGLPLQHHSSC